MTLTQVHRRLKMLITHAPMDSSHPMHRNPDNATDPGYLSLIFQTPSPKKNNVHQMLFRLLLPAPSPVNEWSLWNDVSIKFNRPDEHPDHSPMPLVGCGFRSSMYRLTNGFGSDVCERFLMGWIVSVGSSDVQWRKGTYPSV